MIPPRYNTNAEAVGMRMSRPLGGKERNMNNSKKIIILAVSLVLASVLLLSGCMYLISADPEGSSEYNPDEMSLPNVIEETPAAQSALQKKFGAYGREETGENGEKIYRLFTEEQIAESLSLREKGERRSLTYEEITFIINDSIRMYFEYDRIIVTDFIEHKHPKPTGGIDYDLKIILNRYDRCEVPSLGYSEIIPYHGDYSDKTSYDSALETYNKMIHDIEAIILDRLRIHDTGTEGYCLTSFAEPNDETRLYGILLDGGELTDSKEYVTTLRDTIKYEVMHHRKDEVQEVHPMILAEETHDPYSGKPMITISYCDSEKETVLFPTEQLNNLRPDGSITLTGKTDESVPREITIEFDRWLGKVKYTEKSAGVVIDKTGGFAYRDGVLTLAFANYENIYFKYVDGKFRICDDVFDAYYKDKFDAEMVFEYSSAYGEKFVYPDAFIHNTFPIRIYRE
jgi:hypothetical protein